MRKLYEDKINSYVQQLDSEAQFNNSLQAKLDETRYESRAIVGARIKLRCRSCSSKSPNSRQKLSEGNFRKRKFRLRRMYLLEISQN